jgi:phage terminase large subunit
LICFNKIKDKNALKIKYKLDEFEIKPKLLMTCNPSKSWLYSTFYKPFKEKTLPQAKKFIQSLAGDNPYLSKSYLQNLLTIQYCHPGCHHLRK